MRQMAYGSGDIVVHFKIQYQRNCSKGCNQLFEGIYSGGRNPLTGRQNIIGILKEQGSGINVTAAFASGHGMASDKTVGKAGCFNMFMNVRLCTAHIG